MDSYRGFIRSMERARTVLITTHLFPDADGIGGQVALCLALRGKGINALCVNEEELPDRYGYLVPRGVVLSYREYQREKNLGGLDLFIVVDTHSLSRIGANMERIGKQGKDILFIDHHPCTPEVMAHHCIDPSRAATGEIIGELIEALGVKFSKEMAQALYASILIDTNCFRYPTVSSSTHGLIAKLMDAGVKPQEAYGQIYGTKNINHIRLLGEILEGVKWTRDKRVAWIAITNKSLRRYGANVEDTHAFINHLLILEGIQVACAFREVGKRQVKLSLRSSGKVDVGSIAESLGGGGHHHSAAVLLDGSLEEVAPKAVGQIRKMIR